MYLPSLIVNRRLRGDCDGPPFFDYRALGGTCGFDCGLAEFAEGVGNVIRVMRVTGVCPAVESVGKSLDTSVETAGTSARATESLPTGVRSDPADRETSGNGRGQSFVRGEERSAGGNRQSYVDRVIDGPVEGGGDGEGFTQKRHRRKCGDRL